MNPKVTRTINMLLIVVALFGLAMVLPKGVSAQPGVPNQFYGTVTVNGAPAQDNLIITAKIGSTVVANTLTKNGKYGYDPNIFYVQDPNGDRQGATITFYVATPSGTEIRAATHLFNNGDSTDLPLSVTGDFSTSTTPTATGGGSSGGGGAGGGSSGGVAPSTTSTTNGGTTNTTNSTNNENAGNTTASGSCTPNWKCSEWTECVNGQQKRVCFDTNECGTNEGKPAQTQSCAQTEAQLLGQNKGFLGISGFSVASAGSGLLAIILIAIIIGAFVLYRRSNRK
jgi:hypothetical protein